MSLFACQEKLMYAINNLMTKFDTLQVNSFIVAKLYNNKFAKAKPRQLQHQHDINEFNSNLHSKSIDYVLSHPPIDHHSSFAERNSKPLLNIE